MAFLIKYQAIKGFSKFDQKIKVKFCQSKSLIPVVDDSTAFMRVTTRSHDCSPWEISWPFQFDAFFEIRSG